MNRKVERFDCGEQQTFKKQEYADRFPALHAPRGDARRIEACR
jgi:hypothetical protein